MSDISIMKYALQTYYDIVRNRNQTGTSCDSTEAY